MSRRRNRNRQINSPGVAKPTALDHASDHQTPRARGAFLHASFEGPLPPPELLARYNDAVSRGAERIMAMAESQIQHRQHLERAVIQGNVDAQRRGQHYAFILALVAIVGGMILIAFDKKTAGIVAIISALAALFGMFIFGRVAQSKERRQKRDEVRRTIENPRLPLEDE